MSMLVGIITRLDGAASGALGYDVAMEPDAPEPEWVKCDFCKRRDLRHNMTEIGISESSGPSAPLMCKVCVEKNDREAQAELKEMK